MLAAERDVDAAEARCARHEHRGRRAVRLPVDLAHDGARILAVGSLPTRMPKVVLGVGAVGALAGGAPSEPDGDLEDVLLAVARVSEAVARHNREGRTAARDSAQQPLALGRG